VLARLACRKALSVATRARGDTIIADCCLARPGSGSRHWNSPRLFAARALRNHPETAATAPCTCESSGPVTGRRHHHHHSDLWGSRPPLARSLVQLPASS
jgi:hypothetical protein